MKDGLDTAAVNGTFYGGHLMYGYKLVDTDRVGRKGVIHKVAIDEEQAQVVKYIFEQYAAGVPKKEIAAKLNEQGHRIKGKPFTFRTFESWLTNSKYIGEFTFGSRICKTVYPAIIDKALFQKVQDKLAEKKFVQAAKRRRKFRTY